MARTGDYRFRVEILRRAVGAKGDNGADAETWAGGTEYSAARDALTAGETIAQGVRQSTGFMKLRIKGRTVPVSAADRLTWVETGELFEVTGVERDVYDTVISVERYQGQTTGQ